ncbi:uncharacterized protein LOC143049367 isoform X2 [Mytilus galloprovincialis]|uniref:uncharacterized protein LOC143049367 isoform X2 n=1 Tax=Mytilus galloprovincialis TaxID=29158 RepID=UPI003F7C692A
MLKYFFGIYCICFYISGILSKSTVTTQTSWNRGAKLSITTNTVSDDEDVELDGSGEGQNDLADRKIISKTVESDGSGEVQTDFSDWKFISTTIESNGSEEVHTNLSDRKKISTTVESSGSEEVHTHLSDRKTISTTVESSGSEEVHTHLSDRKTISTTVLKLQTTIDSETCTQLVPLVFAVIGWTLAVVLAATTVFYKRKLLKKKSNASNAIYSDLSGARELTNYSTIDIQATNEHYEDINLKT